MTARLHVARLRIDESALSRLTDEQQGQLLDADVRSYHPEAVRVSNVVIAEIGAQFALEARYVFIQQRPTTAVNVTQG